MYDRITILHTFFLTFTLHIYIYLYIFKDHCVLLNNSLKFPTKHGTKEFLYRALKDSEEKQINMNFYYCFFKIVFKIYYRIIRNHFSPSKYSHYQE